MSVGSVRRRTRLGLILLVVLVVGLGYSTAATGSHNALTKASLRLDWTYLVYHTPFLYGLQKGYYKDEGIDLKINEGQGSSTTITLVGRGKDTFGFGDTSTAVQLRAKGLPVKTALVIQRKSGFGTACFKDVNFKTPKDLEGHSVLLIPFESTATVWPAYLSINGVDASQVKVVSADFSNKIKLFIQHQADCMAGVVGEDTLIAQIGNKDIANAVPWSSNGIKLFGHGIVVSDSTLKQNPELVRGFIRATIRAWREVCAKPSRGVSVYLKKFPKLAPNDKKYNTQSLPQECSKLTPGQGDPGRALGPATTSQWATVLAFLKKWAKVKTSKPVTDFFTNSAIPSS
jgi:NitT/TauT family transport system substrate-binding protein